MYRLDRNSLKRYYAFQGARPMCEGNYPRGEQPHEIQVGERFWAHTTGKQRRTKYYCQRHRKLLYEMGYVFE